MMFISGSVAPAHIDAINDAARNMRSLVEEYDRILCIIVSPSAELQDRCPILQSKCQRLFPSPWLIAKI